MYNGRRGRMPFLDIKMQTGQAIKDFAKKAAAVYGDRLKSIILYGSRARGEATGQSDTDLAVVLAGEVTPCKEIDRLIDIITDINLEYGVLLSVYPVSEEHYLNTNSPLLINLRREGVAL